MCSSTHSLGTYMISKIMKFCTLKCNDEVTNDLGKSSIIEAKKMYTPILHEQCTSQFAEESADEFSDEICNENLVSTKCLHDSVYLTIFIHFISFKTYLKTWNGSKCI